MQIISIYATDLYCSGGPAVLGVAEAADDLHEVVVGVGGQRVAAPVQPEARAARDGQREGDRGRVLKNI